MSQVLIIDDDEVDFMIYSRVIKLGKYSDDINYKNSAEGALEYLQKIRNHGETWPKYIFVDINMPGMDGFTFIEKYTSNYLPDFQDTRIYMVSSSDDFRDKERAKTLSAINGFITKPLTIEMAREIFS